MVIHRSYEKIATGHTRYTDAEAVVAVPFVIYISFGAEPITGQSYAP